MSPGQAGVGKATPGKVHVPLTQRRSEAVPGFLPNPRPGARKPYRRFVPATEVEVVEGQPPRPLDGPLVAPLPRSLSWPTAHRMTQSPQGGDGGDMVAKIRGSATISRGTRMVKIRSGKQLAGYLHGWLPQGFCYREFDIAHVPTVADFGGLTTMPPGVRIGSPVLGTGFVPSGQHMIPEFVTAHLADLPLTAFAELLAYTGDGTEVVLYNYVPEQRSWSRMAGPQWRWLYAGVPGVAPEQEFFAIPPAPAKLIGIHRGVEALARRTPYVRWRDAPCTVVRDEGEWLRVRLIRPSGDLVARVRANAVERGVYEAWAPRAEALGYREVDVWYEGISPPSEPALRPQWTDQAS